MFELYKLYRGKRFSLLGARVEVNGRELDMRNDLYNHSPDGPEWGYSGSGPAQLALAILADYFGIAMDAKTTGEMALAHYQDFKEHVIAKWDGESWTLDSFEVAAYLEEIAEIKAIRQKKEAEAFYRRSRQGRRDFQ